MILANFKKNFLDDSGLLRILMALVFISAGFFRIFNPGAAEKELLALGLPVFLTIFLALFEIVGGSLLLFKGKAYKYVVFVFVLFLFFALILALTVNGRALFSQAGELFVFSANPVDFFLHFVFIIILLSLIWRWQD